MRGNKSELDLGVIINRMWSVAAWISYSQLASELGSFPSVPYGPNPAPFVCSKWLAAFPKPPLGPGLQGSRVSPGRLVLEAAEGPLGSFQQTVGGTRRQNKPPFLCHVLLSRWRSGRDEGRIVCKHLQQEPETGVFIMTLVFLPFFPSAQGSLSVETQRKIKF